MPAWKAKLLTQLPFLTKVLGGKKSNEDSTGPGAAADEDSTDPNIKVPDAAAEKKKKIIRAVIAAAVLYGIYDTMMPSEEPVPEVTEAAAKPKPSKKKLEREKARLEAEAKAKAEAEAGTAAATTEEAKPVEETAATEATTPTAPTDQTATTPTTTAPDAIPSDDASTISESEASAPVEATAPEEPVVEEPPVDNIFSDVPGGGEEATPTEGAGGEAAPGADQITDNGVPTPGSGDMTDQILKDLEKQIEENKESTPQVGNTYIEPPDYNNSGRGLVYNCKEKHWACVDGPSFKVCQQNNSSLKSQGKLKECYPDSVYQSEAGCAWIQKKKITSNTKTDFCL
ncbi:MAG: hypothetical protein K2P81_02075 [Bacteriovoracaceae bacterium]|nr:hypothetical protein [Bacteriovoracaceae bacterium]